jgi:hypothetical protein
MIPSRSPFAASIPEYGEPPMDEPRGGRDTEVLRAAAEAEAQARRDADESAAREAQHLVQRDRAVREQMRKLSDLVRWTHATRADTTVVRGEAALSFVLWCAAGAGLTFVATRFAP